MGTLRYEKHICEKCGKQMSSTYLPAPKAGGACPNNKPAGNHVWRKA